VKTVDDLHDAAEAATIAGSPTSRLVERVSGFLARKTGRRGFLARSAVVGSAIAANPVTYALRPTSAYAAICNCSGSACDCGQLCCDGYTEFCCTLNGANKCPPGTLLGGWWKVDGSGFCGGGPRYYMDCNAPCNACGCGASGVCSGACSGTGCGCAMGDCNNRKAGCTLFRYGQCNQHVGCIGPIVCRVVTCVPPWALDGTCTTTVRVDGATAGHDRACLHSVVGSLDAVEEAAGGARVRGWALDFDTQAPVGINVFVDGGFAGTHTANSYRPDVGVAYRGWGDNHGYDVTIPVGGGAVKQVCVWGVNAGAGSEGAFFGCRTLRLSTPYGAFDGVTAGADTVRLTGWAVDPDTAAAIKVHVYVDDVFRGEFTANAFRPDVGSAFGVGNFHGFDVDLSIAGGNHRICVYAINVGAGSVNNQIGCKTIDVGRPFGTVDQVSSTGGGLLVQGWAIDPDTSGPIKVHAYVDGAYRGEFTADRPRPDVAAAHPGSGPNHGYEFTVAASPGQHFVCVYAINEGAGGNPVIGCRTATRQTGDPFGALDSVVPGPGSVRMRGWVLDPDTTGPVKVHVYIAGAYKGEFDANDSRPDVAAAYPGYGQARGFDITVPTFIGFQEVAVFAINVGAGANRHVGTRVVVVGGHPYGSVDTARGQAGGIRVTGWVIDPDTADAAKIHVYVDGAIRGEFTANQARPDVGAAYPAYGSNHGFNALVSATPGQHQVCVYAINLGWGGNQLVACRTVVVP
jgi:hypothetical protein